MTLPRLSEHTLAKNANKSDTRQRANLSRLLPPSGARWGYGPLDRVVTDLFNLNLPLLGSGPLVPLSRIDTELARHCRGSQHFDCLSGAARAIRGYVVRKGITGRHRLFGKLKMGKAAGDLVYWAPMVLNIDGRASVICIDPRKSDRLDKAGIRYVLSMMDSHIRNAHQFTTVSLAVLQINYPRVGIGQPYFTFDDEFSLYDYAELQKMTNQTYAIWQDLNRALSGAKVSTSP